MGRVGGLNMFCVFNRQNAPKGIGGPSNSHANTGSVDLGANRHQISCAKTKT